MGEMIVSLDQDIRLDTTRARLSNLLKRHRELSDRLTRDSDKTILDRLNKEFEAARRSQSQEVFLDGEEWNDGLLATLRERVHMEADRKADNGNAGFALLCHPEERVTYRVGNKVICCLDGSRIGIQYETSTAGETYDVYHCVLESKSFLEKMIVLEHTIPFFLPLRDLESDLLFSNAKKFIDSVGDLLQAYVDRKEQVRVIKELYGNQISEIYHSLPYHMIEFSMDDCDCKFVVSLRYGDLLCELPTKVRILVWPMHHHQSKKQCTSPGSQPIPVRLSFAEDAFRIQSLPEAYAEIMQNMPNEIQQLFQRSPS
ncbi:Centromere protein O [Arabidopsis thaliana x Arabidopsis arenosa]|uniref:Centromere protein O n=1 Tax=Arabidopsis thaliana x Arabidopsis arenosa TaxID=1240361 RepID=A0A8T1YUP7_9BRAS|nr:Centromere protein O [Arabidopsis thaliana x Arabidopsis arenosa]